MNRDMCNDEDLNHFRMIRSIFILILVSSGVGMGFFFYYLIGLQISTQVGQPLWQLDATTPPFVGIILLVVFMVSWIGYASAKKVEKNLC